MVLQLLLKHLFFRLLWRHTHLLNLKKHFVYFKSGNSAKLVLKSKLNQRKLPWTIQATRMTHNLPLADITLSESPNAKYSKSYCRSWVNASQISFAPTRTSSTEKLSYSRAKLVHQLQSTSINPSIHSLSEIDGHTVWIFVTRLTTINTSSSLKISFKFFSILKFILN